MSKFKPMAHQAESIKFLAKRKRAFDASDPGCVSADTEFLTPTGWKRIDSWEGEMVAQFHPETKEIEFVEPLEYIKLPCKEMVAIAPVRGTSQRLSPEHRVLFYRKDGSHGVTSAYEFMVDLRLKTAAHNDAKFCTTFTVRSEKSLPLTDAQIRVMVATIADGHFGTLGTNYCVVRLKKPRKVQRLQSLLEAAEIEYKIRPCGGADKDFKVISYFAPLRHKWFGSWWWDASQAQLEVISDELCYWDSSLDKRPSDGVRFSTLNEMSADFAQYAFAASKRTASLSYAVRDRRAQGRDVSVEFNVQVYSTGDGMVGPGRADSVFLTQNPEGFKYCFEVPSTFLLLRHKGHIFATGNTGKTLVQITDFAQQHKKDKKAMLVLCPKSLMQAAWGSDIAKFAPHLRVSLCYAQKRTESLNAEADVYVVNVDGAKDLAKMPKKFWKKFGRLVIDESEAYKHHTSQRSKAVKKIAGNFEYVRLMSGTPATNGICNLWHQYYILDDGERLGKTFYGFRSACCEAVQTGPSANHVEWRDREGIELVVAELVKDITIRHKFEDCVDIPENHTYSVPVELSKQHRKVYEQLKNESIAFLQTTTVTAVNGAVLAGKLLQASSGAVYSDDGKYAAIDTERYELVMDLVEARKHVVVFYLWEHQREELEALAKSRKIQHVVWDSSKPGIVDEFQAGKYQVLFAHPASAGHGLTLTKGTATIWASPTYNLSWFTQGMKRVHRIGQKKKTENIVVVAKDTIDEQVFERLMGKQMNMVALLKELE
jgi:hypothetical protein